MPAGPRDRLGAFRWVPHLRGTVGHDHPPALPFDGQDDIGVLFHLVTVDMGCSVPVRHGRIHLVLVPMDARPRNDSS
jgi:hypothetical protein